MKKITYCISLFLTLCFGLLSFNALAAKNDDDVLRFYIVRHGQTFSNIKHMTIGGGGNAQLTPKGRYDARSLGLGLSGVEFISAYSSTLGRAYETANNILTGRNQSVTKIESLKDISWGEAEGGLIEDLPAKFKRPGNDYDYYFGKNSPVKAEDMETYSARIDKALRQIAKENKGKSGNILVVGHSSLVFYFEQYRPNMPLAGLSNTSVSVLEYKNGEFTLLDYNNSDYLKSGQEKAQASAPLEIDVIINPLTIFSDMGVMEGTSDSDLSKAGIKASKTLHNQLQLSNYVAAYTSSLDRAHATANIILNDTKLPLIEDANLDEIFLGYWESDKISNIKNSQLPQAKNLFSAHHVINFVSPNGGEDGVIAAYRFKHALSTIAKQHEFDQGRIVIFTHPIIFKAFANQVLPDVKLPSDNALLKITLQYKNENFSIKEIKSFLGK